MKDKRTVKRKAAKLSAAQKLRIVQLYTRKRSPMKGTAIAKVFKVRKQTVYYHLRRAGITSPE